MQNLIVAVVVWLVTSPVYGHDIEHYEDPGALGGFLYGALHPLLGPDHLLAMLSVGILSAQMGGSAIWKVPATFVAVMVIGGIAGLAGLYAPGIETGIAISVLLLGLALLMETRLPDTWAMAFVAFFGFFHGYAHGVEIPAVATPVWYAAGFVASTATIHIIGLFIGFVFTRTGAGKSLLRLAGGVIAGAGGYFFAASYLA